jgi:hypothetical protein
MPKQHKHTHPWSTAFSLRRRAVDGSHVRTAPVLLPIDRAREDMEHAKRIVLDVLRTKGEKDDDGNFVLLETICNVMDKSVIETVLLLHEINGRKIDSTDGELYVYAFFDHGSGKVYVELWETV